MISVAVLRILLVRAWGIPPTRRPMTEQEKIERWGFHGEDA